MVLIHGTCVEIDGVGVLLRGPPGSGKSDLALRLLEGGARLVADDQTELRRHGAEIIASAPVAIAGRLEIRGVGILAVPATAAAPLGLVVDLVPAACIERLPEPQCCRYLDRPLPLLLLAPFEASAAAKLRAALREAISREAGQRAFVAAEGS
ncbi:MAG: HPr kinase/phosphatase C-terminal domain-containing protein [Alphaproteobacteria bacterium]|nr:HPr kinase/phosphatase C-terminal domain-containing protein [Alphaproteobacteria bacterium]